MRNREEGAAAVEFAIVATLLMLLVFGVIEFGLWIAQYESMSSAAREGARVAAVRGDANGDNMYSSADVTYAVTQAAAPYPVSGAVSITNKNGVAMICNGETYGQLVYVKWTQTFANNRLFFRLPLLPASREIKGVFRCESSGP
jgi:Flp pilus assembly protein TadG